LNTAIPGRAPSKRGVGVSFGEDVTKRFLEENSLELIVRSHEVRDEGYQVDHGGKCITIFSAPNYCDQMQNKGAFLRLNYHNLASPTFTTYTAVVRKLLKENRYVHSTYAKLDLNS